MVWLPADSKALYQQGLEALTTENALHNANPGFQPIVHMLSTTSPKNTYLSWLIQTLWPPLIPK